MNLKFSITEIISSLFHTFEEIVAPRHCELCGKYIDNHHRNLEFACDECLYSLPKAPSPEIILNSLIETFPEDELFISNAYALFSVNAENRKYIEIIHSLKYKSFQRIGFELGSLLGKELIRYNAIDYDGIIPIPIHNARKRERGFNQSEIIASAVSDAIGVPIFLNIAERSRYTISQTNFNSTTERKSNLENAFSIMSSKIGVQNQSFLLIDDVLTTGATINSLAKLLIESGAKRIDSACLAKA